MSELDVIGTIRGTDKSSTHSYAWDYLRHYEELFRRWKYSAINLIEIGVFNGASLDTWHEFFESATLIGLDIDPNCSRFARDRIVIKIGSQDDPSFLQDVIAEYRPTIVIDDGSHIAHHMITSFETIFPKLAPGGIYIFEDLSFHFEDGRVQSQGYKSHQGLSDVSIYDYLSRFIRARAANADTPKNSWGFSRYAFENIDSITVFGGIIVVRKTAPRNYEQDIDLFEREMLRCPDKAVAAARYAHYLVRFNVYQERAVDLLREALQTMPNSQSIRGDLFHVLSRLRRFDEAADLAEDYARIDPGSKWPWHMLAEAERQRGRPDLELIALTRLADFVTDSRDVYTRLSTLHERAGDLRAALAASRKANDLDPGNAEIANRIKDLERRS